MRRFSALVLGTLPLLLASCGGSSGDEAAPASQAPPAVESAGAHPVAHGTFSVSYGTPARTLGVTVWYPAQASARPAAEQGVPFAELYPPGPERDALASLVAASPAACVSRTARSVEGAAAIDGALPVIAFSHCHACMRVSSFSLAERLASHGFVVVAPDHAGDTLFAKQAGTVAAIDEAVLATRAADVRAVLDATLDPAGAALPPAVRGHVDAARVGVFGHSFGGVTTGLVLQLDPRVRGGLAVAAPMEFLPPTKMQNLHVPVGFLLAREDHSVGELGNGIIRQNAKDANLPSFLVEVADAGHWSFSDVPGLVPDFAAGCGEATRQGSEPKGDTFTYLDPARGRAVGQAYVTAFFRHVLLGDESAHAYLRGARPSELVTATARE